MKVQIIQPGRPHTVDSIKKGVDSRSCCPCVHGPTFLLLSWLTGLASLGAIIFCGIELPKIQEEIDQQDIYDVNYHLYDIQMGYILGIVGASVILGFIWVFRLIMAFCSQTAESIKSMAEVSQLIPYVENIRSKKPTLDYHVENYHFETRTTTQTTYVNGRAQTTTSTHQVKVVTSRDRQCLIIEGWNDETPPIDSTLTSLFLSVYFTRQYVTDDQSRMIIERTKEELTAMNKGKDTHFSIVSILGLEDYEDNKLFCLEKKRVPFLIGSGWYFLANVLLMWYPYEMYYRSLLCNTQFDFIKRIQVIGAGPPQSLSTPSVAAPVVYLQPPPTIVLNGQQPQQQYVPPPHQPYVQQQQQPPIQYQPQPPMYYQQQQYQYQHQYPQQQQYQYYQQQPLQYPPQEQMYLPQQQQPQQPQQPTPKIDKELE